MGWLWELDNAPALFSKHTWLHLHHYQGNHANRSAIAWPHKLKVRTVWLLFPEISLKKKKIAVSWNAQILVVAAKQEVIWAVSQCKVQIPTVRLYTRYKHLLVAAQKASNSTRCAVPGFRVRVQIATSTKNPKRTCCRRMTVYREVGVGCCYANSCCIHPHSLFPVFSVVAYPIIIIRQIKIPEFNPNSPPHTWQSHKHLKESKYTNAKPF